jgi:DNA-binding transcriptional ArsR family regulator
MIGRFYRIFRLRVGLGRFKVAFMSSSTDLATSVSPTINPVSFFGALGHPLRWQVLLMLAGGAALSASDVAKAVGRNFDGVSKHLRALHEGGVVALKRCENDGRFARYYLPSSVRNAPGILDYGFCKLHLSEAVMSTGGKD